MTEEEIRSLADKVAKILAANSQGVSEIPVVEAMDGINSLPCLRKVGDAEEVVEVPIPVLAAPSLAAAKLATEAAGFANEKASLADTKATLANEKAGLADAAAKSVDAAKQAALEAAGKATVAKDDAIQVTTDVRQLEAIVEENEEARETSESQRNASEQIRQTAEVERKVKETARIASEEARQAAETERGTTETERKAAELLRAVAEEARDTSESQRMAAEQARQTAETDRVTSSQTAVKNATDATARLNNLSDHRDEIRDGYWWHWNEGTEEYENTEKAAKGVDGKNGKGFTILGYYDTLDLLKAAITTPAAGDAYGVGAAAPYNIYVYDGVTNDWVDNGKLSGGGGDPFQLGEFRYSSRIDNPFGEKYVMCAGQSVSSDDYPNVTSILGISSMSDAKSMPYTSLTEAPYSEAMNIPFQITGDLIGKMRTVAIIPTVENPTNEDYMAMYASMKMYVDISKDGEIWTNVYEFPKKEGEVLGFVNPFLVNGKLIFPLQIVRFDLTNGTQTTEVGRLLITSDFENFQFWEEVKMNVPGALTTQWEIKSMAYGQGVYLAIFTETVGGQQKMALLKSTDLITWGYATEAFPAWTDAPSDVPITVFFSGNRWVLQLGYAIICEAIVDIDNNHVIDTVFDSEFRQVFHLGLGVEESYLVLLSNGIYSLSYDTNRNKWKGYKHDPPSGWGNEEQYACAIPFGSGLLGWIVLGQANHYYLFPSGTEVKTLSYDIAPDYPNYPIKEVFKIGGNLFLVQNYSNKSPYISKAIVTIPLLSNPEIGLNAYIKLKE